MLWFLRIFIFLSIIPLQTILLEKVQIVGIKPDLALVWIFAQGWFWGIKNGLYWGLALGGLLDIFSIGVLGLGLVLKGAVGCVAGALGRSFLHLSLQLHSLIFFFISFLHDISGTLFLHGIEIETLQTLRIGELLIRALYNTVFGIGLLLLIRSRINNNGEHVYGGSFLSTERPNFRE